MEHADELGKESPNSVTVNEVEAVNSELICGLSDDISLMCLARILRKYHSVMKCVSKRWRDLICSEEWISYRRRHKLDETWIYALCRDKYNEVFCYVLDATSPTRSWKLVNGLPPYLSRRKGMGFEALGNKLFFLGGCSQFLDSFNEVYSYDGSSNCWAQAPSLSTPRYNFACEVLDEKLYAIGGRGSNSSYNSWETLDPIKNCWTHQTDHKIIYEIRDSVVLDEKILVRCSRYPVCPLVVGAAYEPSSGAWEYADKGMVSGWSGPAVAVDGSLYVLDQSAGTRLMLWHKERREWICVGKLSSLPIRPPCKLVAIGRNTFIVGRVLSTVIVDVANLGNVDDQVVQVSAVPGLLFDANVISVKFLSI